MATRSKYRRGPVDMVQEQAGCPGGFTLAISPPAVGTFSGRSRCKKRRHGLNVAQSRRTSQTGGTRTLSRPRHPHFQQPELFRCCLDHGIAPIGFCPIGSPNRPDRDRTPEDTSPLEDPVIVDIAERLGLHPAVVCVKWAVQRGQTPIPFSIHREKCLANLSAAVAAPLSDDEMRAIAGIDRHNRLIKGQVFLWRDGRHWTDLWDPDGVIAQ